VVEVIRGVVRDQHGEPLQDARVLFVSGPEPLPDVAAVTGADGAFALTAPVPGNYAILCSLTDGRSETRHVTVTQDADDEVSFAMPAE
jgi:protocatechuate 3,4-dioxygenase beta subunit